MPFVPADFSIDKRREIRVYRALFLLHSQNVICFLLHLPMRVALDNDRVPDVLVTPPRVFRWRFPELNRSREFLLRLEIARVRILLSLAKRSSSRRRRRRRRRRPVARASSRVCQRASSHRVFLGVLFFISSRRAFVLELM